MNCLLCGSCCYYQWKGKLKKCKHLVKTNNKTLCRVYHTRLGRVIDYDKVTGKRILCMERKFSKKNYEGCPYNTTEE